MDNLDELIEDKFLTIAKFSMDIENLVKKSNYTLNYIDAIIHYCNENNIDYESIPKLLSKPLKERIKCDAIRLNFIKKTTKGVLPF